MSLRSIKKILFILTFLNSFIAFLMSPLSITSTILPTVRFALSTFFDLFFSFDKISFSVSFEISVTKRVSSMTSCLVPKGVFVSSTTSCSTSNGVFVSSTTSCSTSKGVSISFSGSPVESTCEILMISILMSFIYKFSF
uniref:Uncharacterized protein n=1 Tax=Cacopsylla melanoneura TaxID=428564 RepID=A0A8D9B628_9HEMI